MNNKPLISFSLFSYNNENYLREAIDAAFSQTYSPLEIILSDDCSSDNSFEIMKAMAESYQGPHKIILNRNSSNLGIGAHINRIMEIASGELIVIAAGDDISVPERAAYIYEEYKSSGGKAKSIFSKFIAIDHQGNPIEYNHNRKYDNFSIDELVKQDHILLGCSHAWSKECFNIYGPMITPITCEDMVIPIRSSLLGEIRYIEKPLVKYRIHQNNTWNYKLIRDVDRDITFQKFWLREQKNIFVNWLKDIKKTKEIYPGDKEKMDKLFGIVSRRLKIVEDDLVLLNGKWDEKIKIFMSNIYNGISYKSFKYKLGFFLFPRIYRIYLKLKYRYSG